MTAAVWIRQMAETCDLRAYCDSCSQRHGAEPGNADAVIQYAEALGYVGRSDEKLALLSEFIANHPNHAMARLTRGLERLMLGEYAAGWDDYRHRFRMPWTTRSDPRLDPQRRLKDQPVEGKTIVLAPEQGLGDTLQFVRFARLLQERGARIVLNVQPPLRVLFGGSPALGTVLTPGIEADIHYWTRLVELTPSFAPHRDDLKWPGAYVSAPAAPAPLKIEGRGLRVGLAWSGNPAFAFNEVRSIQPGFLTPLADVPGCTFFSLQNENGARALEAQGIDWITDLSALSSPFDQLARVIAQMDVVVTVCTSIAHLAGAMGKPVLLMLSVLPDWRWGRTGNRTPWYPGTTLIRQTRFGDWRPVVEDVARRLATL